MAATTITRIVIAVTLALLLATNARAETNPMMHAVNGAVIDAKGFTVLPRCVNLSPWLDPEPYLIGKPFRALLRSPSEMKQNIEKIVDHDEAQAFWRQWEENFVTEADFQHLAEQGFNCVRLPVNAKNLIGEVQNGVLNFNAEGFAPIDRAVAWGAKYGIYVIIDLHAAPGGQNGVPTVSDVSSDDKTARLWEGDSAGQNQALTVALWKGIAARYAKADSVGGYDLLNEPVLPSDAPKDTLAKLYQSIITAIRSVDRFHMVIVEGNTYAHDFSTLQPPPDPNLMYQFHEYAMMNPDWKSPNQKALEPFLQLRAATHMPLWLGEFGENSSDWQQQIVNLMKANQIGWAIWPWKRIDKGNGHPVIQTIAIPDSWDKLSSYADDAIFTGKPTLAEARQGMSDMLQAIRTQNCKEDPAIEKILAGQ